MIKNGTTYKKKNYDRYQMKSISFTYDRKHSFNIGYKTITNIKQKNNSCLYQ